MLKVCYPLPDETAKDLANAVKANKISKERLVEVAMYAPQWLDMAEEVLGMEGFKSGCYYFMAHMNERFDDRKKAVIARYTPLSTEELNNGCFDTNWFFEVYEKLGEKNFAESTPMRRPGRWTVMSSRRPSTVSVTRICL